ncbi:hypothetical protein JF50_14335 [Pseudoalteromonas luteoviolacea]|uniref:Uncharacterized protein n=1 Tax=Pseudoalteromonas luteoviolacea TaxID=43657 RepID=A0A0C1Q8P5_9GAMM|nr:hypothetical protein [Pseudoalteromonas luteoviolacea]KID57036.1 hypothetical protein JF50_14335 [Pseudoalteromonas luteoviolacea]
MSFLKLPIFVASISVPVSLLISKFHSSKLAAKSNALTEKNIAFNHYFDLKRHFKEHINTELTTSDNYKSIEIVDIEKLFEAIFPHNSWDQTDLTPSIAALAIKFVEWIESIEKNLMCINIDGKVGTSQYDEVSRKLALAALNGAFKMTPLQFNQQFVSIAWADSESPLIHAIELLYDITMISGQFSKLPLAELAARLSEEKHTSTHQLFSKKSNAIDNFECMFSVLIKDYDDGLKQQA